MFRILILATAAALTFGVAQAQSVHVSAGFGDLNLQSAAGQKALEQRIRSAAETACGPDFHASDLHRSLLINARAQHELCVRQAIHSAEATVPVVRVAHLTRIPG
jgi:UrcA family protein